MQLQLTLHNNLQSQYYTLPPCQYRMQFQAENQL